MTPSERLEQLLSSVAGTLTKRSVRNKQSRERIDTVCRSGGNRACVRLLMACMLAKLDRPESDPRKPYTKIGTPDSFSGRTYDEQYVGRFVQTHRLPCNSTTAFLTPVLRNIGVAITPDVILLGTPRQLYADTQLLLNEVAEGRESAESVLKDVIRVLVQMRDERLTRLAQLQSELRFAADALPPSSEAIVSLMRKHLDGLSSSRLPVLIVAAAYQAAAERLGERVLPLQSHNAADQQTGAVGDVEVTLASDDRVCTVYEMKQKVVTLDDLDRAVQKVAGRQGRIDNYVFITTDRIDTFVSDHAATLYKATGGTEFVVLDCLGFLRHFLHLFHRCRGEFLDRYQKLLLDQPDSSVGLELKEEFLVMRRATITAE